MSFWARGSGVRPRVVTCWGSDVLRLGTKSLEHRLGVRLALTSADVVTVGSQHLLHAAVRAGAREDRCVLVGWGVDTARFRPDEFARARVRTDWGFQVRDVVLSTRLHKPLYRIDTIIRAFSLAREENPKLALVVAGWGPETEMLEKLVCELGIGEHVRFIGRVSMEDRPSMADVYAGADVFCSIPETDGGPLSVLEAMACELPVVVADIPVMREWISHSRDGYIWSSQTETGLAALLLEAATAAGREAGRRAREYVKSHHERSVQMDKIHQLYASLVAGKVARNE